MAHQTLKHLGASQWTVDLGARDIANSQSLLSVVVELRQAASASKRVRWTAMSHIENEVATLIEHLAPPTSGGGPAAELWRSRYVYGALYERRGPGFTIIRERRPTRESSVYNISDEGLLRCIDLLRSVTSHTCETCSILESEGLVLRTGVSRIFLPFRLAYPPTPFLAI